jgi:hypothetical protein
LGLSAYPRLSTKARLTLASTPKTSAAKTGLNNSYFVELMPEKNSMPGGSTMPPSTSRISRFAAALRLGRACPGVVARHKAGHDGAGTIDRPARLGHFPQKLQTFVIKKMLQPLKKKSDFLSSW